MTGMIWTAAAAALISRIELLKRQNRSYEASY